MGMFDGFFQNAGNVLHNAAGAAGNLEQNAAKYVQQLPGQVAHTVQQAPGQFADVAAAPFRDIYSYARVQMDPQAKAKLDAINNNPKLSDDQKSALGSKLLAQYGGQSDQQRTSAEQGSLLGMGLTGPATGAGFVSDAAPFIKPAIGQAGNAAGNVAQGAARDFTSPQAQAGFVRLGSEEPSAGGAILDKNGNPLQSAPQETPQYNMGSYVFNDRNAPVAKQPAQFTAPTMEPNPNPALPRFSPTEEMPAEAPAGGSAVNSPQFQSGKPAIEPEPTPPGPTRTFDTKAVNPSKDDIVANQDRNIQIDGHDVRSPQDVKQINSTLNGYGIKGSKTEQLQAVNSTISSLANRAQNIVASQGGAVPKTNIVSQTVKNLTYSAKNTIPVTQATKAVNDYIDNLFARANGGDVTQTITGITPEQIPGATLQKMKTLANEDAQGTFAQDDPTKWTQNQTLSRHARDAIDNSLDARYPEASKLNNDMSDLYKSQASLIKGANKEGDLAQKAVNTPPEPRNLGNKVIPSSVIGTDMRPLQNLVNAATNSKGALKNTGLLLGGGAVVGAATEGPNLLKQLNNNQTSNAQNQGGGLQQNKGGVDTNSTHGNMITQLGGNSKDGYMQTSDLPRSQGDVKLNRDGSVAVASPAQIKDASGNIIGIDDNSFNKQVKALNDANSQQQQIIRNNPNNNYIRQQAEAVIAQNNNQIDSLKTTHDSSKPLNDAFSYASLITGQTAQALHTLEQTSPNVGDLNSYIDDLQNTLSPRYAGLKQQLGVIAGEVKGGNLDVKTRDSLVSVLKEVNQQTAWYYYNGIGTYVGGATSPEGTATGGTAPAAQGYQPQGQGAPAQPQTVDFSGLMDHTSGPSFQNGAPAITP